MTVQGRVQLRNDLTDWLRGIRGELDSKAVEAGLEAGRAGRDAIRHVIETTESGLAPGKPNRILTGHMWERADYRVSRTGHTTRVQIGWLDMKNDEKYFEAQELGLGPVTFGMHALLAAGFEAKRTLADRKFM